MSGVLAVLNELIEQAPCLTEAQHALLDEAGDARATVEELAAAAFSIRATKPTYSIAYGQAEQRLDRALARFHGTTPPATDAVEGFACGHCEGEGKIQTGEFLNENDNGQRTCPECNGSGLIPECDLPPDGWRCTRYSGHYGPCAAIPTPPAGGGDAIPEMLAGDPRNPFRSTAMEDAYTAGFNACRRRLASSGGA